MFLSISDHWRKGRILIHSSEDCEPPFWIYLRLVDAKCPTNKLLVVSGIPFLRSF